MLDADFGPNRILALKTQAQPSVVRVMALLTDEGWATPAESSRIFSAIRTFGRSAFRCKNVFGKETGGGHSLTACGDSALPNRRSNFTAGSARQIGIGVFQFRIFVAMTQLALHAGIATLLIVVFLGRTLAFILIPRFVDRDTFPLLGGIATHSNELFMGHDIPSGEENTRSDASAAIRFNWHANRDANSRVVGKLLLECGRGSERSVQ